MVAGGAGGGGAGGGVVRKVRGQIVTKTQHNITLSNLTTSHARDRRGEWVRRHLGVCRWVGAAGIHCGQHFSQPVEVQTWQLSCMRRQSAYEGDTGAGARRREQKAKAVERGERNPHTDPVYNAQRHLINASAGKDSASRPSQN